eukprot:scaffold62843_cov62-Phaeocystis_antarctica.AAC.5
MASAWTWTRSDMHGPKAREDVPTTSEPAPAQLAVCGVASQSTATESTKPSLHQAHIAGRGRHFVRYDTSRVCLVACIHVKDSFFYRCRGRRRRRRANSDAYGFTLHGFTLLHASAPLAHCDLCGCAAGAARRLADAAAAALLALAAHRNQMHVDAELF